MKKSLLISFIIGFGFFACKPYNELQNQSPNTLGEEVVADAGISEKISDSKQEMMADMDGGMSPDATTGEKKPELVSDMTPEMVSEKSSPEQNRVQYKNRPKTAPRWCAQAPNPQDYCPTTAPPEADLSKVKLYPHIIPSPNGEMWVVAWPSPNITYEKKLADQVGVPKVNGKFVTEFCIEFRRWQETRYDYALALGCADNGNHTLADLCFPNKYISKVFSPGRYCGGKPKQPCANNKDAMQSYNATRNLWQDCFGKVCQFNPNSHPVCFRVDHEKLKKDMMASP